MLCTTNSRLEKLPIRASPTAAIHTANRKLVGVPFRAAQVLARTLLLYWPLAYHFVHRGEQSLGVGFH